MGLYYLNSRYYDPETGRFINADDISNLDTENINGLNLYMYCADNPVNNTDINGNKWWHWLVAAAIVIVAGVAVVATAGGAVAGIAAVSSVIAGGSAATVGASVAAGVFIGSVVGFGAMSIVAGIDAIGTWNSTGSFIAGLNTFNNYGEAAMWTTLIAGILGGFGGYLGYKSNNYFTGTKTPGKSTPYSTFYNSKDRTITHYDNKGNMWWSKHLTNHGYDAHSSPHWHLELPHRGPYNSRIDFIIAYLKQFWWFK